MLEKISLVEDFYEQSNIPALVAWDKAHGKDLGHHTRADKKVSRDSLSKLHPYCISSCSYKGVIEMALDYEGVSAFCVHRAGEARLHVHADSMQRAKEAAKAILELLPEEDPTEDGKVRIGFSSCAAQGGYTISYRGVAVPPFARIASNYPSNVQMPLRDLVGGKFEPGVGGQLLLWHGPPGTGKTYALRSLLWEWREWCKATYITDPDKFFSKSDYMMNLVLADEDDYNDPDDQPSDKWQLLILEDASELLQPDAKEQVGQGLSRLLNLTEGLIGQGLRLMVLITTNEPIRKLHKAVARPGRCAGEVAFTSFDEKEAKGWMQKNKHDPDDVIGAMTLAEMYALKEGWVQEEVREKRVGF